MSGANCVVLGYNSFGRTKGIAILRALTGNAKGNNNTRKNMINFVTQTVQSIGSW